MQIEAVESCRRTDEDPEQRQRFLSPDPRPDPMAQKAKKGGGGNNVEPEAKCVAREAPRLTTGIVHGPFDNVVQLTPS